MNYLRQLYFIENTKEKAFYFIYGLTSEFDGKTTNYDLECFELDDYAKKPILKLWVKRDVIEKDEVLEKLEFENLFEYKLKNNDVKLELYPRPTIIQQPYEAINSQGYSEYNKPLESFESKLSHVKTWWMLDKKDYLDEIVTNVANSSFEAFKTILKNLTARLKEETGLSFNKNYITRIGNYEFFSYPGNFQKRDFNVKSSNIIDDKNFSANRIVIERSSGCLNKNFSANIILKNGNDVTLDKHISFPKGEKKLVIDNQEPYSPFAVKIYNENGDLVFQEGYRLLRSIGGSLNVIGSSNKIKSPKSKNISNKTNADQSVQDKLTSVHKIAHNIPIEVGGYKEDPWVPVSINIRQFAKQILQEDNRTWWFSTGALSETDCTIFLRKLIGNSDNEKVVIVDPFFDSYALADFVPFFENQQNEYVIATGWHGKKKDLTIESLVSVCNNNKVFLADKLKIVNFAKSGDAYFHDRYILIYKKENLVEVYSLSNSLNNTAKNHPLCIMRLEDETSSKVQTYIENLFRGEYPDKAGRTNKFDVEEIWSSKNKEEKKVVKSKFYPYWDVFWGTLFDINDKDVLKDKLIQEELLINHEANVIWSYTGEKLLEIFNEADLNSILNDDNIVQFVCGLGESLANVYGSSNDLYSIINEIHDLYTPEFYGKVLACYEVFTAKNRESLVLSQLVKSKELTPELIDDAIWGLSNFFIIYNYNGVLFLFRSAMMHSSQKTIEWLSKVEFNDEDKLVSCYSDLFSRFRFGYNEDYEDLIPILMKSKKPILQALVIASFLRDIEWKKSDEILVILNNSIAVLREANIDDSDILWMLMVKAGRCMYGGSDKSDKIKKTRNYISCLAPFYTINLSLEQKEHLLNGLSLHNSMFKSETINIFIEEATANANAETFKSVEFLWEKCEVIFNEKISKSKFHASQFDSGMLFIAAKAILNLNQQKPIDLVFMNKFQKKWDKISSELSLPNTFKRSSFDYNIAISVYLLYVGYSMLILNNNLGKKGNKKLEEYLWKKLKTTFDAGIVYWSSYRTNDNLIEKMINLIVHYYSTVGSETFQLREKEVFNFSFFPIYMKQLFIISIDDIYNRRKNELPKILESSFNEMKSHFSDDYNMIFLDYWILTDYENKSEMFDKISFFIDMFEKKRTKIDQDWFVFFRNALLFLKGKNADKDILMQDKYNGLATTEIIIEKLNDE